MAVKQVVYKGRQYDVNNLNEDTKKLMSLMKAGGEQIARAQAEIALAEAGRAVIGAKLDQQLKDVPSEAATEAES